MKALKSSLDRATWNWLSQAPDRAWTTPSSLQLTNLDLLYPFLLRFLVSSVLPFDNRACIFGRARNTIFGSERISSALGYLQVVDCNLVALILSSITFKPHWKRKFAILVHTSNSASLVVLSFAHLVLPVPFLSATTYALSRISTQSPLLLECLRMLPHKVCTSTFSFWINGTPGPVACSRLVALVSFPFVRRHSRSSFNSFTILFNSRSLHSPALFPYFFVACGSLACLLCHFFPS
jgi:hypothetical protein